MSNPFDTVIEAAENREAEAARLAEEHKAAEAVRLEALRVQREVERQQRELLAFGNGFMNAVIKRVVKPDWKPEYLRVIKSFCEALLMREPTELPKIDKRHYDGILNVFAYGCTYRNVPPATFYGQQLVAERQASKKAKIERVRISTPPVVIPDQTAQPSKVISIDEARERLEGTSQGPEGLAVTPRSKKPRGVHRKDKQTASAG